MCICPKDKEIWLLIQGIQLSLVACDGDCRFYDLMISQDSNILAFLEEWESKML